MRTVPLTKLKTGVPALGCDDGQVVTGPRAHAGWSSRQPRLTYPDFPGRFWCVDPAAGLAVL